MNETVRQIATGTGKSGMVETDHMKFHRLDAIVRKGMPACKKIRKALLRMKKICPSYYEPYVVKMKADLKAHLAQCSKNPITDTDVEEIFNAMYFPEKLK